MPALIFVGTIILFAIAYRFYGRKLSQWMDVDNNRETPAHTHNDGVDYVPTSWLVLFGHHFSSIAGAGPIVGPIIAAKYFGWGPALIWIIVGSIFIGGVHDYVSHMASVRHRGRSLGEICRIYMSPLTYKVFLLFMWFALIYVLIVFLDFTALSFVNPTNGGAVATSSLSYIVIAIAFGMCVKFLKMKFTTATYIFVPLIFLTLIFGNACPLVLGGNAKVIWIIILLVYCAVASIAPVWILLQPRDYLSSYLLVACLGVGAIGLVVGGFSNDIVAEYPAFISMYANPDTGEGFIYPMLFILVACGAVSGFHSLVGSGTTSKQLDQEKNGLRVAYGAMLTEGVLAVIALCAVIITVKGDPILAKGVSPTLVFANAMGRFCTTFGISQNHGMVFGALAISTFLLTTLDTSTRLSRFIMEELLNIKASWSKYLCTVLTIVPATVIVFMKFEGVDGKVLPAWKVIWPVFGATNQLLAAMALLVAYVWLKSIGKKAYYVLLPMIFMLVTSLWSLILTVNKGLSTGSNQHVLVTGTAVTLIVMAAIVLFDSISVLTSKKCRLGFAANI